MSMINGRKMPRRFVVGCVFLLSILILGGCQTKDNSLENQKLGVVLSDLSNPYFQSLEKGIMETAKESAVEVTVIDSGNDSNKELEAVKTLIEQGVTLLILNPVDSDAVYKSVNYANEKEVPVITVDRHATGGHVISSIVSDNEMGGRLAADYIMSLSNNQGEYAEMKGIEGTSAAKARGKGFNEQMVKSSQMTLAAVVTADFSREKGRAEMERLLGVHPDLVAMFAHNDEMALGALTVAESLNIHVKIIGFDGTDEALEAVKAGRLSGTIAQQPYELGAESVSVAIRHWKGEVIEPEVKIDVVLIQK